MKKNLTFVNDAVNINIPENILQIGDGPLSGNQYPERRMEKVTPQLRLDKNYQQGYDPLAVSLGPYHHSEKELQSAGDFKLKALRMFVADSGRDAGFFYSQVYKHVDYARNWYIEGSTEAYKEEAFAQMMLLDACFIINFILAVTVSPVNYDTTRDHLGPFVSSIAFRDLIILENQIPFRILKHPLCLRYGKQQAEKILNDFLTQIAFGECKESDIASRRDEELPLHLAEAYRLVLVAESSNSQDKPSTSQGPQPTSNNGSQSAGCLKHMGNFVKCSHLGQLISNLPCSPWRKEKGHDESVKTYFHSFHSATDLKAKGIHFRPRTTDSLKGIKFKSGYFYALLEIPTCILEAETKVFFLNMIAYELCPNVMTKREVASYIEYMKSLINSQKDVKELREKSVLLTDLGSDEEVVNFF